MDDYQVRNPTNVEDVARVLYDLTRGSLALSWTKLTQQTCRSPFPLSFTSARRVQT